MSACFLRKFVVLDSDADADDRLTMGLISLSLSRRRTTSFRYYAKKKNTLHIAVQE